MTFGFRQLQLSIFATILFLILIPEFILPESALGSFGLSNKDGCYRLDTGPGLVFKVKQSSGDITSLNYDGIEYQEPAIAWIVLNGTPSEPICQPRRRSCRR